MGEEHGRSSPSDRGAVVRLAHDLVLRVARRHAPGGTSVVIERWYRDSKIYTIFEGTSEIQRPVISRAIPGQPIPWRPSGCYGRVAPGELAVALAVAR